jgi:hypothetical protein
VTNENKTTRWLQPGFLIAVLILAVSAVSINAVASLLKWTYEKQAVPLAQYGKTLDTIPDQLGDWKQVSKDEPIEKEIEDALGTTQYVFRDYVNTKIMTPEELKRYDGKTNKERKELLWEFQAVHPDAVVNCAVTYYTGLVDTVAHIPDRCYIADGFQPSSYETPKWDLGIKRLGPNGDQPLPVRFINFEDQTSAGRVTRQVAYFFFADGQYESDPIGVRKTLATLTYRHGFYSKIELMTVLKDQDKAQQVMCSFLTAALPEIEKCMPDWNTVEYAKK